VVLFVEQGCSVEARVLRLMSRSPIFFATPLKDEHLGVTYPFRMTQNCEAEVEVELDPKKHVKSVASALNLKDLIRGTRIAGISAKAMKAASLIQGTENHRAREARTREFGFAKIDIPLRNILEAGGALKKLTAK
jgi:hypothetical protein